MDLKVDLISLYVCGCGGNGMCCHIYYSTDNFETRTTMFEMKKMPANNMQYVEAKPVLTVKDGQQLLVRVYPWYNGAATGKTICLSDLKIHAMAVTADPAGIKAIDNGQWTIDNSAVYYSLDGKRLSQPSRGLNLVRQSDGSFKKIIL